MTPEGAKSGPHPWKTHNGDDNEKKSVLIFINILKSSMEINTVHRLKVTLILVLAQFIRYKYDFIEDLPIKLKRVVKTQVN